MYKEHSCFETIEDSTMIWRYMDLPKFCSILQRKSLFFARPSILLDPWEAIYPNIPIPDNILFKMIGEEYDENRDEFEKVGISKREYIKIEHDKILSRTDFSNKVKDEFGINSWNIGSEDKEFLWKIYGAEQYGVAIVSTFKKLKDSFVNSKRNIYIGKVNYFDPENYIMPTGNGFWPVTHKRKCYEYESELRAVIWESETYENRQKLTYSCINGDYVNVELKELILYVMITPFAQPFLTDVVADLIKSYKLDCELRNSKLLKSIINREKCALGEKATDGTVYNKQMPGEYAANCKGTLR